MRLLLAVVCLAAVAWATATAAPSGRIASRCSASGDVCYGVFKDRGDVIRFQLTLAAKYYTRYRDLREAASWTWRATTCKSFPVKRVGSQYGGAVKWNRNFPSTRPRALSSDMEAGSPGPGACALFPVFVEL